MSDDDFTRYDVGSKVAYPQATGPGQVDWISGTVQRVEQRDSRVMYFVNDLWFPEDGLRPAP